METVLNSDGDQIQRMQSVIREFKPILAKLKDRRQRTAERFNVFEALDLDEQSHSRFIAYLLNPTKHHDQGDVFLISFLECVGLNFRRSSTQSAEVSAEFGLGSHSRIDIHIRLTNGQIILVENKIKNKNDAPEGADQIAKYQDWLQCQEPSPKFPHQLVFLTPQGRPPKTARRPEEVICISYSRLSAWIDSSSRSCPERLRLVLEKYAETCRRIGGSTNKGICMPDEIRQFFLDPNEPERLETALQIEAHLQGVKRFLFQTFWEQVGEMLTQRLIGGGHDQCWEVRFDDDIVRLYGGFQMAWRNCQDNPRFAVKVESYDRNRMILGVTRNREVTDNNLAEKDEALKVRLGKSGFSKTSEYYPGFRFFNGMQLPGFGLSDACGVLQLAREMRDNQRSLTKQVVRLIWELFCDFRERLEELNHDYPYDDEPAES